MTLIELTLNRFDILLIILVLFSVFLSLIRGFVREVISIVTWILAIWVVIRLSPAIAPYFKAHVANPHLCWIATSVSLFVFTLLSGALVSKMAGQLISKAKLSGADRSLGALFGVIRGILLVSVILLVMAHTPFVNRPWWKSSALRPCFEKVSSLFSPYLPEDQAEEAPSENSE